MPHQQSPWVTCLRPTYCCVLLVASARSAQLVSMAIPARDSRRRLLVVIYFAAIIAFITLFGVLTIPDIVREGADFIRRLKSDNVWVILVEKMRQGLG